MWKRMFKTRFSKCLAASFRLTIMAYINMGEARFLSALPCHTTYLDIFFEWICFALLILHEFCPVYLFVYRHIYVWVSFIHVQSIVWQCHWSDFMPYCSSIAYGVGPYVRSFIFHSNANWIKINLNSKFPLSPPLSFAACGWRQNLKITSQFLLSSYKFDGTKLKCIMPCFLSTYRYFKLSI